MLVLFTLGVGTRLTGVLTWVIVASFTANPAFDDEVDPLLQMLTLYLAVGYLLLGLRSRGLSWPERLLGPLDAFVLARRRRGSDAEERPSVAANLALRLIQVHLAILLAATGLHKLQFGDWWSGIAYWYPLHPSMTTSLDSLRALATEAANHFAWLGAAAYAVLAWQLAFPLFAWREGLARAVLLLGALAGWVGAACLYQMPLFGPTFAVSCLAFFSISEWTAARNILGRIWAFGRTQDVEWQAQEYEIVKSAATPVLTAREQ